MLCLLTALLFSSFLSAQVTEIVLLDEDFNGITTGVPDGWAETADYQYTDWGSYLNATLSKGERCLEAFVSSSSSSTLGDEATLFSPVLTFPASTLTDMMLSFDLLSTSSTDGFSVYISIDGGTTYKPNVVVKNLSPLPNEWTTYNYTLDPTLTSNQTNVKIVFVVTSALSGKRIMLDNVKVQAKPTCKQPIDLNVTTLLQTTATLNWNLHDIGDIPSAYNIIVRDTLTNVEVINQRGVATTGYSMPLTGLTANTTYEIILNGDCEAASLGTSRQTAFVFTTINNPQTLPVSQDFSVGTAGTPPSGWILGGANVAECGMSDDKHAGNDGDMSCKIFATDKFDAYIASPPINHAANDLEISFKLNGAKHSKFMVGLSSDISDASATIPIYSDSLSKKEGWEEFVITSFNDIIPNTENMHVVIYAPSGMDNDNNDMYVDDIMITEIPTCVRPRNIMFSDISPNSVTISWENFFNQSVSDYQIAFISPTDTTIVDANTNPFTYNSLSVNTEYIVSIRQICSAIDTSAWSVSGSFKTYCDAITSFPIIEGFENTDFPPSCWSQKQTQAGSGNGTDRGDENWTRNTSTTYINTGIGSAQLQDTKNGTRTLLVSPLITTTGVGSHEVNFFLKRDENAKLNEGVKVWVNTKKDTEGGVFLGHISHSNKGIPLGGPIGFQKYTFPIDLAGDVFVIFEGISEYGTATFIDDIEIRERPTCIAIVNFTQVDATPTSASFNLEVEEGKASRWIVEYKTSLESEYTIDTINSTSYTLNNLTPNTEYEYEFKVRSYCTDTDNSEEKVYTFPFHTPCLPHTLPYIETFENDFDPNRINCWSIPVRYNDTYPGDYNTAANTTEMRTGKFNVIVSPELIIDTWSGKHISFDVRTTKDNLPFTIGVMTDPMDTSTFTFIDTVYTTSVKTKYSIDLTQNYTGNYFAIFTNPAAASTEYGYIDNVEIYETPTCHRITDLTINNLTDKSAQITIGDTINSAPEYEVLYSLYPFNADSATSIILTDRTYTIPNLLPATTYHLNVRAICDENDTSIMMMEHVVFTTECSPFEVTDATPFFEGFEEGYEHLEELAGCWTQEEVENDSRYKVNKTITTYNRTPRTGDFNIYMYDADPQETYIYRSVKLKANTNYRFSLYAHDYYTRDLRSKLNVSVNANKVTGHAGILVINNADITTDKYTYYEGYFTVPEDGIYYLKIGVDKDWDAGNYTSIDDITLEEVGCIPPAVTLEEVTTTTATFNYTSTEDKFYVVLDSISRDPNIDSLAIFADTVTDFSFVANNLEPNTYYYFHIKSICGNNNESDWNIELAFKTNCEPFDLPYTENFDSKDVDLGCWTSLSEVTPDLTTSEQFSGTHSIEFDNGVTIVSPDFNVNTLVGKQISMFMYSEHDTVNFAIGAMYDINNIESYESIEEVTVTRPNEWSEVIVNFNILSDPDYADWYNAKNIVIVVSDDYNVFFDDIIVEDIPSCPKPKGLSIADITDQTANLSWNAGGEETNWRITVIKDEQVVIDSITNATTMTLSGLSPVSYYTVEARAICSNTDTSGAMQTSFSTICPVAYKLPYTETFDYLLDNQDAEIYVPCWINDQRTDKYEEWEGYVGALTPTPCVEYYLYTSYSTVDEYSILETPVLDLTSLPAASLEFEMMNSQGFEFYVLISEDAGATFTDTAFFTTDRISDLTLQSIDLTPYVGNKIVIGFNAIKSKTCSSGDYYIRIDNVNVFKPSACPAPESVDIVDITTTSVTIAVKDTAGATSFSAVALPADEVINNRTVYTVYNTDTITIHNLLPGTAYMVHVRSECIDEPSRNISSETFNTECLPMATLPYYEGFERKDFSLICSDTLGTKTATSALPEAYLTTIAANIVSGDKALYLKNDDEEYIYFVLPEMAAPIDTLSLEFWYRTTATSKNEALIEVGILPLSLDTTQFIHLYSTSITNVKTKVNLELAHLNVDYGYRITFRSVAKTTLKYAAIDDIRVDYRDTYIAPHQVNISNLTANSATLTVHDAVNTKWQIALAPTGTAFEDYTLIDNVTAPVNITSLNSATNYVAYARAICANGDTTEWSKANYFNTECSEIFIDDNNPYVIKMVDYPLFSTPGCWTVMQSNNLGNPQVMDALSSGTITLEIADGACAIALPKFSKPLNQLYMDMRVACLAGVNNDMGEIFVGYTNDLNEIDSIKDMLVSKVKSGWWYEKFYDLTIFPDSAKYLVIRTKDASDFYIDSINIYTAPDCYRPSYLRNEIVNLTDTSAQLSYKPSPDHVKMEYKFMQGDVVLAEGWTIDNPISLPNNLVPQTEYSFILRSQCNSNGVLDTTIWTDTAYFTTLASPATVPYVHAFENDIENSKWYFESNSLVENEWIINSGVAAQGEQAMYISNNGTDNTYSADYGEQQYMWAYRTFHLEKGAYDLNYIYRCKGNATYAYMNLYIAPESIDLEYADMNTEGLTEIATKMCINETWTNMNNKLVINEEGNYNLAFNWYVGSTSTSYNPPAAIDSVRLTKIECPTIMVPDILNISSDSITVALNDVNENPLGYQILVKTNAYTPTDAEVQTLAKIFATDTVGVGNLNDNTAYYAFARVICSSTDTSQWSDALFFTTKCIPDTVRMDMPFFDGFEDYSHLDYIGGCWMTEYPSTTTPTSTFRWRVNETITTSNRTPLNGDKCLNLYNGKTDMLKRNVYLEAGSQYSFSVWARQNESNRDQVNVALCVENKDGGLDTLVNQFITNGDYQMVSGSFTPVEDGVYTMVLASQMRLTYDYLIIDDLKISTNTCRRSENVVLSEITPYSAKLSWESQRDTTIISISSDAFTFDTIIENEIDTVNTLSFTGLTPVTNYTITLTDICNGDFSEPNIRTFTTPCAPIVLPYVEDFQGCSTNSLPMCWDNSEGTTTTESYKWCAQTEVGNILNYTLRFNSYSNTNGNTNKAVSPEWEIPADGSYIMNFRYMNDIGGEFSAFISTDHGATYVDTIFYKVKNVHQWTPVSYSLDKVKGQNASLILYSKSNYANAAGGYHYIDDIRISCSGGVKEVYDTICAFNAYSGYGFDIPTGQTMSPGISVFERVKYSTSPEECDTTIRLNLYIGEVSNTVINAQICEGDVYTNGLFVNLTEAQQYRRTYPSIAGCDSIVTLNLTHYETKFYIDTTICEGNTIEFGGQTISNMGKYRDSLISSHNCDSIIILNVTIAPKYYDFSAIICDGESYDWEGNTYTSTGEYVANFTNVHGCDSIRRLNLYVVPSNVRIDTTICEGQSVFFDGDYRSTTGEYVQVLTNSNLCDSTTTLNLVVTPRDTTNAADYVCEGVPYYGYGFKDLQITKDTIIFQLIKDADGCESVFKVNLELVETIVVDTTVNIAEGETYTFGGNTYSASGQYTHTFRAESTDCDSIVNLTLNVGNDIIDNIFNVEAYSLSIAPNPMDILGEAIVHRDWTIEEQNNMRMEILDALGRIISSSKVTEYPISISGFSSAGMYYVRIITGTNEVYTGKLIVK